MFSSLLWFISLLLYDLSNLSNIYSAGPSVCLVNSVICCLCCLIQFAFIFLSLTHTHICSCRQLPHAPENPISVLSMTEKRAINLTWAPAFDGNSPLIRYILEVSENSECFSLQHFLSTNVSVSRALMGETEIYILLVWKQPFLTSFILLRSTCVKILGLVFLFLSAISQTELSFHPHEWSGKPDRVDGQRSYHPFTWQNQRNMNTHTHKEWIVGPSLSRADVNRDNDSSLRGKWTKDADGIRFLDNWVSIWYLEREYTK